MALQTTLEKPVKNEMPRRLGKQILEALVGKRPLRGVGKHCLRAPEGTG